MPVPILAVDTDTGPPVSSEHATGKRAIESGDCSAAIKSLTTAGQRDPRNTVIQDLPGYPYRNAGQFDAAFKPASVHCNSTRATAARMSTSARPI